MKSILAYGHAINARNRAMADNVDVYQAGVNAVKDGYNVKAFERVVTSKESITMDNTHVTNIVTVNGTEYRLISLSYDGSWYNVVNTTTGKTAYLNADTVEQASSK